MPLTTTATWPTLTEGRKAKASEVEAKFDWLEGAQLPMSGGNFTTGVYDIGSVTYKWNNGYFTNLVIGGRTMTSSEAGGKPLRGWGFIQYFGGTTTALASFNIAAVVSGTTQTEVYWGTDFSSAYYSAVVTPSSGTPLSGFVDLMDAGRARVQLVTMAGAATLSTFSIVATGEQ